VGGRHVDRWSGATARHGRRALTASVAVSLLVGMWGVWGCTALRMPVQAADAGRGTGPATGRSEVGLASWYGEPHHGQLTASGEIFHMAQLTAAHRTLPLGTRLRVTNLDNGRIVRVRVNDRGPYVAGRVLDLSHGAARALDMVERGVTPVRLDIVEP